MNRKRIHTAKPRRTGNVVLGVGKVEQEEEEHEHEKGKKKKYEKN